MKKRAPANRTLTCAPEELDALSKRLVRLEAAATVESIANKVINQDIAQCAGSLPRAFVDLMILDPPYNLTKNYHGKRFQSQTDEDYQRWFETALESVVHVLKPDATVYVCGDWRTSTLTFPVLERRFKVRNRITWEREKGRGAKTNWKNNAEDIWFCTVGDGYYFDVDAVKMKRRVLAPYRTREGVPKDWDESKSGKFRLTYPSNIWSDITVPFWSMPENTDHPTQKPEKLIAKLVLASSKPGDVVFDPFLGSGTTAVVAQKLGRSFVGVEINTEYCCWTEKRLDRARTEPGIAGYVDGVFWERNSRKN